VIDGGFNAQLSKNEVAILSSRIGEVPWQQERELAWALKVARQIVGPERYRWAHTLGVVRLVNESLTLVATEERSLVLAAAYVHDIGHARRLRTTGCHALDGALYVREAGHPQLASMVAQHSGARCEAALRGLETEMAMFTTVGESSALDVLTFSDLKTDHQGYRCSVDERLEGIATRYGDDHIATRAFRRAQSELRQTVSRVESRLRAESSRRRAVLAASGSHRSVA
jgi:hypothetical protein